MKKTSNIYRWEGNIRQDSFYMISSQCLLYTVDVSRVSGVVTTFDCSVMFDIS